MSYVPIKGGGQAIAGAASVTEFLRTEQALNNPKSAPLDIESIQFQLRHLVDRVISEGGVYHPELAALSIKQSLGDTLEAAFTLRAWRSTRPRLCATPPLDTSNMRVIRRISAAFKDIPGGQMLGATPDYALRLLRMELMDESSETFRGFAKKWLSGVAESPNIPCSFPKVVSALREEGLLPALEEKSNLKAFDITREPLIFPVSRSAALATMARAETGSLLSIAYSNMRGYGDIHPTVAELRVGYVPVMLPHAITGELIEAGEVLVTECEVIAMFEPSPNEKPVFTIGYGACLGHNEVKSISMAILDRALQKGMKDGASNPSEDAEFVLLHIDGVDSMGFASHYKMPHYVTFQSDMDRLRMAQQQQEAPQ